MSLRLAGFCAGYGRVPVVRDISLEIGRGGSSACSAPMAPARPL